MPDRELTHRQRRGMQLIYHALGGSESPLQQPGLALLGHPQTKRIPADADTGIDGAVWCRPYGPSYALPTEEGDDREEDGVSPFTAILPIELRASIPMIYGQPVKTERRGGRLVIVGTMELEANVFTGSEAEQPAALPVERQQLQWLTVVPNNPPDMGLMLIGGVVRVGNDLRSIPNLAISDLSSELSGLTAGQAKAVLIAVDTTDNSLVLTAGSAFTDNRDAGVSDHHALFANYPQTLGSEDIRAFALVKLYKGMTEIVTEDLYPLLDPGDGGGAGGATWLAGGTADLPETPGDLVGFWDNETGDVWMRNGAGDGWLGPYNLPSIGGGSGALTVGYKLRGSGDICGSGTSAQLTFSETIYDTGGFYNAGDNEQTPSVGRWQHTAYVALAVNDTTTGAGYISAYITGEYAGELPILLTQLTVLTPTGLTGDILLTFPLVTVGNVGTPNLFELWIDNFSGQDVTVQANWIEGTRLGDQLATP